MCAIVKVHENHNQLKLNTKYKLDDYADNLEYLEIAVIL